MTNAEEWIFAFSIAIALHLIIAAIALIQYKRGKYIPGHILHISTDKVCPNCGYLLP